MRAMYEKHLAARELAAVPMERRLRQYATARPRDGELSLERIVQSEEGFLRLVTRAATGVSASSTSSASRTVPTASWASAS
jgi:hypothetical protein